MKLLQSNELLEINAKLLKNFCEGVYFSKNY